MNQKIIILLFATVFYYGVTSSPLGEQKPGLVPPEEKPPTNLSPTTEHFIKKTVINGSTSSTPSLQVQTSKVPDVPSQAYEHATEKMVPTTAGPSSHVIEVSSGTIPGKNQSVPVVKSSNESLAVNTVGTSSVTPSPFTTKPVETKSLLTGSPENKTVNSSTLSPQNNATNMTSATTNSSTSAASAAATTSTTTTTTTVSTTCKESPKTVTPVSVNKDNVEHNTPAPVQEKHFDGQSFIGGMALTIGLTAIAFIAFKYYKSGRIDMNYRTL